jgi:hypothetical protein
MAHQRVEYTSGGQNVGNACGAMIFGFLLFFGAFPLLIWNEGVVVTTTRSLEEGLAALQMIEGDSIDPLYANKLVHFTGDVQGEVVGDERLGVAVAGAKLDRRVDYFQWVEKVHTRTEKTGGGGKRTIKSYSYQQEWSNQIHNSENFDDRSGEYQNPRQWPVESSHFSAQKISVGAFTINRGDSFFSQVRI